MRRGGGKVMKQQPQWASFVVDRVSNSTRIVLSLAGLLALFAAGCSSVSTPIITTDLDHFSTMLAKSGGKPDVQTLQREYLDRGTPGLREFEKERIGNATELASVLGARSAYYDALKPQLATI